MAADVDHGGYLQDISRGKVFVRFTNKSPLVPQDVEKPSYLT